MAGDNLKHLTDSEFDATIGSDTPCLVDFWAPWCGP
ncbi:MAG: thiol reductase thioredoxin, partial [Desulfobulbaceae bacterium]|nr:thiol reductase thioredoxin [Desulfobulbaceae bacterium]